MIQDVITRSANSLWPQISLILFVLCFVGVLLWTFTGRKDRFRHHATLPLEDSSSEDYTRATHE